MKARKRSAVLTLSIGLMAALLAGCNESRQRISDLMSDQTRYVDHTVQIAGEVTQVHELPLGLTSLAAYRVNDGTGQIWVVSHAGAPLRGDHVGVRGRLEPITTLNVPVFGNILGNVIDESRRRMQ